MKTVGVRELEEHINEMLHQVQETGEILEVTDHGEVIAHLVPVSNSHRPAEVLGGAVWTTLDRVRAEIDAHRSSNASTVDDLQDSWTNFDHLVAELDVHWPEGVSAADAVRDVRREL